MNRELIRTPDQRLRVFVSSTLDELRPEREAARTAIETLRLAPVMFELGARPHPPRDLYRAYLEQSHVFVGIYWQRYGWTAPGEEVSGLEDEYNLSESHPRLIYVKKPAPEPEPALGRLLARIREAATLSYRKFATADELRELIQNDLALLLAERFEQAGAAPRGERLPAWARTNLPVPRNALIGREAELAAVCGLLRRGEACLVTLIGPGGSGKSRLALEAGLELLGDFEDGAFLVALESIRDPSLVIPEIASTLGVRVEGGRDATDALAEELREAHVLLVLDNCEQVLEAGPAISTLLERCAGLAILATSRAPLRVRAERRQPVPPLSVPLARADVASLSQYAAVALFAERARSVRPDFEVTTANAPIVAEICHRLDGLPLAIELAAARLRLLAPAELLARLGRRFDLLRGGTRDLPERQQTLRRTIDWSHELLDRAAQRAFRRLSVFAGGASLDAAEAVVAAPGDLDGDALDLVGALLDESMLTGSIDELGGMRIGMLDTMREYAAERLAEAGELEDVRRAHALWYLAVAEEAEPHLVAADEPAWAARLRVEGGNIRAALDWSTSHDPELGLRIAAAIARFWEFHGSIVEGHRRLEALLAVPGSPPSAVRARALHAASLFARYVGEYGMAREHVGAALEIWHRQHDEPGMARALHEMGSLALSEDNLPEARRRLTAALDAERAIGDRQGLANTLANLGILAYWEDDLDGAEALLRESLTIYEERNERLGVALATGNLADIARERGRLDDAWSGQLASLRILHEIGDTDGSAACLLSLGKVANAAGDHASAVRLFALASALRDLAGTKPPARERADLESELRMARSGLESVRFDAEWRVGLELTMEDALRSLADPPRAGSAARHAYASQPLAGAP